MTAEAARALTVVGTASPSEADVRAGRSARLRIQEEIGKLNSENLDAARKLSGELAKGNVDFLAKYREQKPKNDQAEEKRTALTSFQQMVTTYWDHLKAEHVDLVKQVLEEERDSLQRDQNARDQTTLAQIKELDTELAALGSGATTSPTSALVPAPEPKPPASKGKA